MNRKKKYQKKSVKSVVKEPLALYVNKPTVEFKIFNSFQEQEDDNYKWLASLSGEEHLANAVNLIKRLYAKELRNPSKSKKKITVIQ